MNLKRLFAKGMRVILQPPAITRCDIAKSSKICSGTNINDTTMERYSYVGHDCFVLNANIGPFVSIADNCRIGGSCHPISHVSTSPVFHDGKNIIKKNFATFTVDKTPITKIDADVWIAANAIVMSGVHIGVGAVVGAGSVVTKDVPPYEIWAGNPAKFIRKRFDEKTINDLIFSKWWEFEDDKLVMYTKYFNCPKEFLAVINELQ